MYGLNASWPLFEKAISGKIREWPKEASRCITSHIKTRDALPAKTLENIQKHLLKKTGIRKSVQTIARKIYRDRPKRNPSVKLPREWSAESMAILEPHIQNNGPLVMGEMTSLQERLYRETNCHRTIESIIMMIYRKRRGE